MQQGPPRDPTWLLSPEGALKAQVWVSRGQGRHLCCSVSLPEPWRLRGAVTGVPGAAGLPSLRSGAATGLFQDGSGPKRRGAAGLEKLPQHERSRGQSRMASLSGRSEQSLR